MGSGASSANRMPFSLKLQRKCHPLAMSAFVDVNVVPAVDQMDSYIKGVKSSWGDIMKADERTDTGMCVKGSELFSLVFTERFKSLNCGAYAEQLLNQACFKYGMNHSVKVVNFIFMLEGRKPQSISRKLKSVGKDHLKRQISHDVMDMFLNSLLLAIGDRLGDKASREVMTSWANLLLCVASGMRADEDASNSPTTDDGCSSSRVNSARNSARSYSGSRMRDHQAKDAAAAIDYKPTPWDEEEFNQEFNLCSALSQDTALTISLHRTASDGTEILPGNIILADNVGSSPETFLD